jgi:ribosomal protein L19E
MIQTAYDTISTTIKKCLASNQMSITDAQAKEALSELERILNDSYRKPLSRRLYRRARREYKQVKRLQEFLRQRPDIIVCQIDKSPGFYIGDASTIELKAYEYMINTNAYREITNGQSPLADNLRSVQTLLDNLLKQKAITKDLYDKLYPKMNKLELAHFHGLPKIHKVI